MRTGPRHPPHCPCGWPLKARSSTESSTSRTAVSSSAYSCRIDSIRPSWETCTKTPWYVFNTLSTSAPGATCNSVLVPSPPSTREILPSSWSSRTMFQGSVPVHPDSNARCVINAPTVSAVPSAPAGPMGTVQSRYGVSEEGRTGRLDAGFGRLDRSNI